MRGEKKPSAFAAGIGYTIGNILIKGIGILTLPLFSRIMSTAEFGVYNVFISYDSLLFVVVGLALHSSVRSANLEFRGKIDDYISSISLLYLLNLLAFIIVGLLFGNVVSKWLGIEKTLVFTLILYSFSAAVLTLYNTYISLNYEYKKYLIVALINTIGNVLVSLLLILTVFRAQKDVGRIVGSASVLIILAVYILISVFRKARPHINGEYWKFALKYSLPIVPHGISQVLLAQFDRIMIRTMVSDAAAGIYSLAGNIKIILTTISSSVSAAWNTWFFEEMDKNNRASIQKRATQLAALFVVFTTGLLALVPELILILGGKEYDQAKFVAIPIVLEGFVLFLYELICVGEYYKKKTVYIMWGTVASAALNVILNYIFIRKYGFFAAAYTTLFSYICYLMLHLIICRRLLGFFILPLKWLALYCAIVTAAAVIDIWYLNDLFLRWGVCAIIILPITLVLLHSYKGISLKRILKIK